MPSDPASPRIQHRTSMLTDVGVIREHNEDSAFVDPVGDFFIVADGMGGHAAGEVASAMAVEAVAGALGTARAAITAFIDHPSEAGRKALVALLEGAVRAAHQAVFERGSRETDKQGMGTTLDVVLFAGDEAFVAHVGDSRTYLVRDGKAAQITTDHTVAEVLVIEGKLSPEEAQVSPLRTILVNALGVAADVGVEMAHLKLRKGDFVLLCSDGLHDYFPLEQEIAGVIGEGAPDQTLAKLVGTAKTRGGHDNITGVLIEILEVPLSEAAAEMASADTGEISLTDAVPQPVGRDDTQPVNLADLAHSAQTQTRPPLDRAQAPTDPAPIASGQGADREEEPDATMPLKQIQPKAAKKKRKKGSTKDPGDGAE